MIQSEAITVLKEGNQDMEHKCDWAYDSVNPNTPNNVTEVKRICRICGRVEQITQTRVNMGFEDVYEVFHGKD